MAEASSSRTAMPKEILEREAQRPQAPSLANPGALGLAGFAFTTFMLNLVNAGIVPQQSLGMVLPMGVFFGGMAQFTAGMWDIRRGDTFGGTCFSAFGAFWMGLALMDYLGTTGVMKPVPQAGMAWFLAMWGFFTAYASVASFKVSKAVAAVFVSLTILFFLLAWGQYSPAMKKVGGYEGLICALIAFYTSAGVLINTTWGRQVLPLGPAKK